MMLTANATSELSPFPSHTGADRSADECSPPTTNGSPSPKSSEGNGSLSATYSPSSTPTTAGGSTRNEVQAASSESANSMPSIFAQTSNAVTSDLNAMFSAIFENNNKVAENGRAQVPNPLATSASAALLAAQQQFQQLAAPSLGLDHGALLQLSHLLSQQQNRLHLGKQPEPVSNRMPTTRNDDAANQDKKRTYPYTFQFCVLCQKNVHSSKLPCHIRQCHVGKPMFQCPACDFTSTYSKNNVKSHMVSLHGLAGDPISYMDQYAGQVEEFMKKCFPNVRGRGRPVHGRSSPISPSLANGAVNGSASGDTTPVSKRPTTIRHSHSRQQRHRSSNTRFPNAYNISALTSLPNISKVEPNSELMQLNANSPMNILQETLNVNRFSPYSPHRPRPNRETPVPSVMDFLSAAVAAQTQKTQQASVKFEQKNEPLSSLPVVAVLGSQDPTELTSLNDIATIEFCDTRSPLHSQGKVLNEAVAALVHHDTGLSKDDLERFNALKVVVRIGSDVGNIDVRAATELGIAVCNTPAECVEETADSTMSLILNMYRKTFWLAKIAESGTKAEVTDQLRGLASGCSRIRGSTLAIIGLGRVGTAVAVRARGFGFRVVFYDPLLPDGIDRALGLERCGTVDDLLLRADCISLHCTYTPETHHMINEAAIKKMKPNTYLINTSRRELVAEEALLEALKSGHVKAAALDIQDDTARGIWSNMPNVICTPNASWFSDESSKEMRGSATREIRRAIEGQVPQDLLNCLNKHELVAAQVLTNSASASSPRFDTATSPPAASSGGTVSGSQLTSPPSSSTSSVGLGATLSAPRTSRKQATMSVDSIAAAIAAAATNAHSLQPASPRNGDAERMSESHESAECTADNAMAIAADGQDSCSGVNDVEMSTS